MYKRQQIDWPELMRFKRSFTEPVPKRREDGFATVSYTHLDVYKRQVVSRLLSCGLLSARWRDRWHPKGMVAWYRKTIHQASGR